MDTELILICALTGVINLIGALAYAARIAGVGTGRIASSFALFKILRLVSRTSNGFLGPFLAKRIETSSRRCARFRMTRRMPSCRITWMLASRDRTHSLEMKFIV